MTPSERELLVALAKALVDTAKPPLAWHRLKEAIAIVDKENMEPE